MPIARCIRIREPGGPEVLALDRVSVSEPGPGQILVEVVAAGLNRADLLQRRGAYPAPPGVPADVPGLEYAGHVAALGDGVTEWEVGDEVMGIVGGGAMATHLLVHAREAMPVPAGLALAHAAAIPEAFLTAYDALFEQGRLGAGESLLVHAVASGVGTAALALARFAGAHTIGTSRTESKLERMAELGLTDAICVQGDEPRFAEEVKALTGGRGVELALDLVGGPYLPETLDALALKGRLMLIGLTGGRTAELPLGTLLRRRIELRGSVLRNRPLEEKASLAQRFATRFVPAFGPQGRLAPVVDAVMPMKEIAAAHALMERNETFGKLVLAWA